MTGGNGGTDGRTIEVEAAAGGDPEIVRSWCTGVCVCVPLQVVEPFLRLAIGPSARAPPCCWVVVGRLYIVVVAVVVVFHARTQAERDRRGEVVR